MPDNVGDTAFQEGDMKGLAFRRVGGELRAFMACYNTLDVSHEIFEVIVPSTLGSTVATAPYATVHRRWGVPVNSVDGINNLYCDDELGELWFTGGDTYIDNGDFMRFGRVALNDVAGTLGTSAVWRLDGPSSKFCMHGITPIP